MTLEIQPSLGSVTTQDTLVTRETSQMVVFNVIKDRGMICEGLTTIFAGELSGGLRVDLGADNDTPGEDISVQYEGIIRDSLSCSVPHCCHYHNNQAGYFSVSFQYRNKNSQL